MEHVSEWVSEQASEGLILTRMLLHILVTVIYKVKCKVHLITGHEGPEGE